MLTWWGIYPRFMRDLFTRAFTTGLADASLGGRITEGVWRRAFVRLRDSVSICSCTAELFWDPDDPHVRCWHCGETPPSHPRLEVRGHKLVLCEGAVLSSHHLRGDHEYRHALGRVEPHPKRPGDVVLSNLSDCNWTVRPTGEDVKKVRPGQRLGVRPMSIDFGPARGTIRLEERSVAPGGDDGATVRFERR
jgi:hypothetical protein